MSAPPPLISDDEIVLSSVPPRAVLVLLHGLTMKPEVLLPFAGALSLPIAFCVPRGPIMEPDGSRSWWAVDATKRCARLATGPSDLFDRHPKGRSQARQHLNLILRQLRERWPSLPLLVAGYSQGGMLATDYVLLDEGPKPDALLLLSSTCIALDEWQPRLDAADSPVRGMPVLVMHGEHDNDLALAAGLRLRGCMMDAGAQVQWQKFDGGHELPPVAWRGIRRFVLDQLSADRSGPVCSQSLRSPLQARWALCWQPMAAADQDVPGPAAGWLAIDRPQPVAAALADLGLFSLDAPTRSFDDEVIWYRADFDAPECDPRRNWTLGLDGLATVTDVWLNGEKLLSSRSMFRRWVVPLKDRLREKDNQLLLRFDALNARLRERRPPPRWRVPMLEQQQLRWWRTTLLGRTPGWSPPVAVVGPWLPIWIDQSDPRQPEVLGQRAWLDGTVGHYQITLAMAAPLREGSVLLRHKGVVLKVPLIEEAPADGEGRTRFSATVSVSEPLLWWPHTHGKPILYESWLEFADVDGYLHRRPLRAFGFRRLQIDDKDGGFVVRVNGESVFCRGACWTPLDPLRLRAEPAAYDAAVRQLRHAGMNMLRIAGAMAWESEALFDACDRQGILVWHDLMLANMDYPGEDPAFLEELRAELTQQLPALQARPCLALVCGNSEVAQQAAMWGTPPALWHPALFHSLLPAWVAEVLPDAAYWPSSTHGGDFPHQPRAGTSSYYGIGAYQRPLDDARHSGLRFASECLAFANIPSDDSLARLPGVRSPRSHQPAWKARVPRDLGAGWDFDDVRDHYVEHLFGERADALRYADPERYLAFGRAASAEAMVRVFDQWRASDSRCGGALVWFLRDMWPGAGWGLLDDQGQPKAAFHALARVLQPTWIGWIDNGLNGLELHWAHEGADDLDATVHVQAWRHGEQPVAQGRLALSLPARGRGRISLATMLEGFVDLNWAYRFGPVAAELVQARLVDKHERTLASTLHFAPALLARRTDIGLTAETLQDSNGNLQVRLSTRAAALGVYFEVRGWLPSDEYFHLAPGEERILKFSPRSRGDSRPWCASVTALNTHEVLML